MAAIWSEPNSPFFQPLPGFAPGVRFAGGVPGYENVKVNKPFKPDAKGTDIRSELPYPVVGIDFSSGQRDVPISLPTQTGDYTPPGSPVPSTFDQYLEFTQKVLPYQMQMQEQAARLSADLSRQQLADLAPYLSRAGWESTARNLLASKSYAKFKEQLPSNVQNIMASKQAQMQSAQAGEAALMAAVADQQRAATAQASLSPYYGLARYS